MAGEGILVLDAGARILVFNRVCEALFGWSAAEAAGRPFGVLLAAAGEAGDDAAAFLRELAGTRREVGMRRRDGAAVAAEISVEEVQTPDGHEFVCTLRDLGPRREDEARLAAVQAELSHLARIATLDRMGAALAHELNQPLTALSLYLQAAERSAGPEASTRAAAMLAKARAEAARASRIIQSMRRFAEKRAPKRDPVDLPALVDEAVELTLMGVRTQARVRRSYAPDLPPVTADGIQIQQVAVNLLRNALDAVEGLPEAWVDVELRAEGGTVRLTVRDSGAGIAPEALSSLFRPFASGKPARLGTGLGMGLGLTISKAIADAHGGRIEVDPGGGGRGAAICLVLPAEAASRRMPHGARPLPRASSGAAPT